MRYLILSDIHANIEALDEVLNAVKGVGIDKTVVLGDIVDYGPNPNEVISLLKDLPKLVSIRGDHEKGVLGALEEEWFSSEALKAVHWTRSNLAHENLEFIKTLPKSPITIDGTFTIVHGSYMDEDMYLFYETEVRENLAAMKTDICFFGHTHIPCVWGIGMDGRIDGEVVKGPERVVHLSKDRKYLINPGSVGQPRDGNPASSFLLYDSDQLVLTFQRVSFDFNKTAKKILEIGLDFFTAERLRAGI